MRTRDRAHAVGIALRAIRCTLALIFGLILPFLASADDGQAVPPPDPVCSQQCAAMGFGSDYCDRACRVPPAQRFPPTHSINWDCATQCRAANGNMGDCIQACNRS